MTLNEGRRVRLAAELRLTGTVTLAEGSPAGGDDIAGSLSLGAGIEGTVERVDSHVKEQGHEVREYLRLTSLLDDFGHQMPPGSRGQLEEQIASLVPVWQAYEQEKDRVTVRVRLDNGFVLDDVPEDLFTTA
ncbi:hypothetical protein [Streptomyces sp. NBC_01353]|uniref:hypothetical protein n=1 Tax=Streptomyces sp. NBC_01353 TaxID=2903835 RepID=UPI002E357302|nr:hypothetical protein [Streptomyces sp. NBC_01353]